MKGTKNKPKLRFPEFTEAWEQRKFSELVETRRGLTYKPTDIREKGVRVLRSSNIDEDQFVLKEDDVFVDERAININFAKENDILITAANGSSRLVGKHAIVSNIPAKSVVHGGFMLLGSSEEPYFANALMSSSWYKRFIDLFVSGGNGAIGNLNKSDLDEQVILVPRKSEQQAIGHFFANLDRLITLHQRKLEKIKEIKKGLMQKLFSQEVRFKADDGSEFPEWEEKKLGDVGDIMTGNTPSTKQEDYYGGCYLWITPTDITDSREVSSTAKRLTELGYAVARHIPANSVLVTCIASIGKNAIMRENGSCNQQINSITPYDDYNVEFIYYLICQNEKLLHANAGTGGMEILNKDSFSKIKMCFPCLAEQQKIAECLSSLDDVIEKQKATLAAWEKLKKGLLQQMFI